MKLAIFYNKKALQDTMLVSFGDQRSFRINDVSTRKDLIGLIKQEGQIKPSLELIDALVKGGDIEKVEYEPSFMVGTILKIEVIEGTKLAKCYVHIGAGKKYLSIVCGATNLIAGSKVVVATAGTVMPDGMVIEPSEIAGTLSEGMLCSAKELGMEPGPEKTILILDSSYAPGTEYFPGQSETKPI